MASTNHVHEMPDLQITSSDFLFRSNRRFILLDSKHTCFFCLKGTTQDVFQCEEGTSYRFPLRNISRFLKFSGEEGSISNKGLVETCKECSTLTDEFTDLYKVLDMTQIRMNWCLRKICKAMEGSETGDFKLVNDDGLKRMSKKIVNLRNRTILNGRKRIRASLFPTISVKRLRSSRQDPEEFGDINETTQTNGHCAFGIVEVPLLGTEKDIMSAQDNSQEEDNPESEPHLSSQDEISDLDNLPSCDSAKSTCLSNEQSELGQDETPRATVIMPTNDLHLLIGRTETETLSLPNEGDSVIVPIEAEIQNEMHSKPKQQLSLEDNQVSLPVPDISREQVELVKDHDETSPLDASSGAVDALKLASIEDILSSHFIIQEEDKSDPVNGDVDLYQPVLVLVKKARVSIQQQQDPVGEAEEQMKFTTSPLSPGRSTILIEKEAESSLPNVESESLLPSSVKDDQPSESEQTEISSDTLLSSLHEKAPSMEHLEMSPLEQTSPSPESLKIGQLSCPFCRAVFTTQKSTIATQRLHLKRHIAQFHCERYFPTQKLATVSHLQYKQIFVDLLFKDICNGGGGGKESLANCPFCPRFFYSKRPRHKFIPVNRLKVHLIKAHLVELEAKLLDIRDPQLSEKLRICNPGGVHCACGVYLSNSASHKLHQLHHCTRASCNNQMSGNDAQSSVIEGSEETPFRIFSVESGPLLRRDARQSKFLDESEASLQNHSSVFGKDEKIQSFLELAQQKTASLHITTVDSDQADPSTPSSTFITKGHLSCPFCRATFRVTEQRKSLYTQQTHLRGHILRYHCEQYFPNHKLVSVTEAQYKKILADLLFQDFCIEKNGHIDCPWCKHFCKTGKLKYHKVDHLARFKLHLLDTHREELEVKLRSIQQDPLLSEKLRASNLEGIHCDCGVYLASFGAHKHHYLYHCKKTSTVKDSSQLLQQKLHLMQDHSNSNNEPSTSTPTPSIVKCVCGAVLKSVSSVHFHQTFGQCKMINASTINSDSINNSSAKGPSLGNCDKCGIRDIPNEMMENHRKSDCIKSSSSFSIELKYPKQTTALIGEAIERSTLEIEDDSSMSSSRDLTCPEEEESDQLVEEISSFLNN